MTDRKIISADEAASVSRRMRAAKEHLVFTNGCFDLLHVGHVRYLEAARHCGDALLVAVNGDQSVRVLKGAGRPINSQLDRATVVAALECVTCVVIFEEVRATALLRKIAPAVYVKGGDYSVETLDAEERAALEEIGAQIQIVTFAAGYSTSSLVERLERSRA